jgi:hypothetical protein
MSSEDNIIINFFIGSVDTYAYFNILSHCCKTYVNICNIKRVYFIACGKHMCVKFATYCKHSVSNIRVLC